MTRPPGYGPMPKGSRFAIADRVQVHGYVGCPTGLLRTGFRGVVLGSYSAACGRGVTDDGREFCEPWGHIVPEGAPNDSAMPCTCCPRIERKPRRESNGHRYGPMPESLYELLESLGCLPDWAVVAQDKPEQLDLFDLIGAT